MTAVCTLERNVAAAAAVVMAISWVGVRCEEQTAKEWEMRRASSA